VGAFVKRDPVAPPGFFALEAAGLRWLADAGGVPCAEVLAVDESSLTLRRLDAVTPTRSAAREFGAQLAVTHAAGAPAFGAGPDGWTGPGYFGPLGRALPMSLTHYDRWGEFYAEARLLPMAATAGPRLSEAARADVEAVADRCRAGDFDDDDPPARVHGDLWSGNAMWTADGVVVIDPAAHGGHREADLAMVSLFGCPHLADVLEGYQAVHPLRPGWPGRRILHQLYPLLAHVALFGGGYVRDAEEALRETRVLRCN
jgi:fructosamine-3-kinase